jgi:hypothetical protein
MSAIARPIASGQSVLSRETSVSLLRVRFFTAEISPSISSVNMKIEGNIQRMALPGLTLFSRSFLRVFVSCAEFFA